jgi:adenylate cyclase
MSPENPIAREQPPRTADFGRSAGALAARLLTFVLGPSAGANIPERVRRIIASQQAASEIIVGWMQVGAIIFFAAVYTISPKAFPPGTAFEPVPWTLGIYALFTALRLALAYRERLTRPFIALSVLVDMMVLMITIWSFHLQYQAPPALYLKAPTLMYVFILIALRTLRFEAGYVMLAGIAAAVGWSILFGYAVLFSSPDGMQVTHSYVDYVTSYRILGGAEIDKILSILMVTGVLTLSLIRARRLLVASVANAVAATDLARFFAPEVAEQIRRSEMNLMSGQGERRDAAILSIDLRGFTKLSAGMSAAELIAVLGEYHARLVPIIQHHGGSIDKYLGDGILASFGATAPSKSYAADLCRAVDALTASARAWQQERTGRGVPAPGVGMAGAVGEVVFGTVGHETRLEYTVIGEVVNLVAKLEKHTKREAVQALTTRETYALAMAQGYRREGAAEHRLGRRVEGAAEPIDLVVLAP